jgi:hypothetical protein
MRCMHDLKHGWIKYDDIIALLPEPTLSSVSRNKLESGGKGCKYVGHTVFLLVVHYGF